MFKLGYKQTVFNSFDPDTMVIDATQIKIAGFCDIKAADAYVTDVDPVDPVGGTFAVSTIVPELIEVVEDIKVSIALAHAGSGQHMNGKTTRFTFMSDIVATADQASIDTAILNGYNNYITEFADADVPFETVTVVGGLMTIVMKDTAADINITSALYAVNKGSVSYPSEIIIPPETGYGKGWQIEQSVQMSTYDNRNPYKIHVNAADIVDINADYKTYIIKTDRVTDMIEPAEALGYGDANTDTRYELFGVIIFANTEDAALTGALDLFIGQGEVVDSY